MGPVVVTVLTGLLVLSWAGCGVEFLSTPPATPGAATAPAEVVALAGPDLVVLEGSRVVLAGGASRALAGDPELSWTQREGPLVVLSNPSSPAPIFVAPLGPARLVFVLEASADAIRDVDQVVVDVVVASNALPAGPLVLTLPADRTAAPGATVTFESPWTGAGTPLASARCAVDALSTIVSDGVLQLTVAAQALPCPIVVDDIVTDDDGPGRTAGRAAITLWPPGTPIATPTRVTAPAVVGPGAVVALDVDVDALVFFVDGTPITKDRAGGTARFLAPRRPGRLTLLVDNRRSGTSGGARAVAIGVSAGTDNAAPLIDGGPDLRVRPGARFRIAPKVIDDDDDDITVDVHQVLGLAAGQGGGGVSVLVAPDGVDVQTLLFHVSASDGSADSAIDAVRVTVDPNADNVPPIVQVPAELYVTPGSPFVIDASGARDPDAGLVVGWRVAQDPGDPVIVLPAAIDEAIVPLTAGAAGDRYRFTVSVIDDDGLESSAIMTVMVEEAGPYVDVDRGSPRGTGTPTLPFASIDAALLTAARHRFPALLVAATTTTIPLGPLPDGLGLEGGLVFDDEAGTYTSQPDLRTTVRATGPVQVAGARLAHLTMTAGVDSASLRLQRRTELDNVECLFDVVVASGARVRVDDSALAHVEVDRGSLELHDTVVTAGLASTNGTVELLGRTDVSATTLALSVNGGVLRMDAASRLRSPTLALRLDAGAVAAIAGAVVVDGGSNGVGVHVVGGVVEFVNGAVVTVSSDTAVGINVDGGTMGGRVMLAVRGQSATGLHARAALGGVLAGSITVEATVAGVGVDCADGAFDQLRLNVQGPQSLAMRAQHLDLSAVVVSSSGAGIEARAGLLRHVTVITDGVAVARVTSDSGSPDSDTVLRLANSLIKSAGGISGGLSLDVVGFAGAPTAAIACPRCLVGPADAVGPDGSLASDASLGAANPFVDSGDLLSAVDADVDGHPVPQGAGPDVGAVER
jgi:hypothetical protein